MRTRTSRPRRRGAALLASAGLLAGAFTGLVASPASAAGGVLDLVITPVNQGDGTEITDLSAVVNGSPSPISTPVTYKVQYSCTTDVCDGTQVQFTPPPADPWGLNPAGRSILRYASWVAPAGIPGATIGGDDLTGKTINLGNLAAGTSGTFSVTYNSPGISGNDTAGGQFFPDGSDIEMSATASSTTASSATSDSSITWHIGTPAGPAGAVVPSSTVKPDVTTRVQLAANSGSMQIFSGASIQGDGRFVAAGDYKIVFHAPAQAVIGPVRISTAPGAPIDTDAVVDNVAHTVTWTKGSLNNPVYGARGAWGGGGPSAYNSGGAATNNPLVGTDDKAFWQKRVVELTFPVSNFPEADGTGCNFRTAVTNSLDVTVHYLDDARTLGTKTINATNYVACGAPFGGLNSSKQVVASGNTTASGDGDLGGTPSVYAVNVPATGNTDLQNRAWRVNAFNLGNVDGTVVIDEPNLDKDHIKVNRITVPTPTSTLAGYVAPEDFTATVEWEDNTGDTGTATLAGGEFIDVAPGRWFTSATTTAVVPAGRILRTDSTQTQFFVDYRFKVDDGAVPLIGQQRTNSADVTISYPSDADGDGIDDDYVTAANGTPLPSRQVSTPASRTVQYTQPLTTLNATFNGQPVVQGGGAVQVGTHVTFGVRGQVNAAWPGTSITPQTVFIAPVGWKILPGSASFTAAGTGAFASIPAGVTYTYGTGTFGSETRDYVVATYPSTVALATAPGVLNNWPTLSTTAYPTNLAVPGVNPIPATWAGDASGTWYDATTNAYLSGAGQFRVSGGNNFAADGPDVDGDGNTTEELANLATAFPIPVTASDALSVVKEICVPDAGAPGGCDWAADPTVNHEITTASDVKYRIRVSNAGNTTLHGVTAYDVLPYVGDTGLLAGAASRGSQFAMTFSSVDSSSAGLDLAFSGSTNPARPEVYPGAAGTTNDWGAGAAGKKAIRITVTGDLAAGEEKQVTFLAAPAAGADAPQKACNTVAIDSTETLPAEPLPVCVQLNEADLSVTTGSLTPWKEGEATTIPFTIENKGGGDDADASVAIDVPAGMQVDDLTPTGWSCTVPGGGAAPVDGAVTLTCTPVDGSGDPRTLDADEPETLSLAVTPTAPSATPICVGAEISGSLFDPVDANNTDEACATVADAFVAAPALTLDKSSEFVTDANGNGKADKGDVLKYTFSVENTGNVDVDDVAITDAKIGATTPASVDVAAGDTEELTANYTVTQADVDAGATRNSASATGTPTSGGSVTSNTDTDVVPGPDPVPTITVQKEAELTTDAGTTGKADVDDVITYTITVHNAGPATAHDVSVTDPLAGLSTITPASVATLAPGDDAEFTATYTVKQSDVDNGSVVNTATASFRKPTPPGGPVPALEDEDSNEVTVEAIDPDPSLSIEKTSTFKTDAHDDDLADKGDVLTYSFEVENTGNVTLTGVTVDDALAGLGAISPAPATLAPGASQTFTADYTVTQGDVDAGGTFNEATAVGTPPAGGKTESDPDDDAVDGPDPEPVVTVTKEGELTTDHGTAGKADPGDVITYTFTVHNAGPATAKDVSVTDPLAGLSAITPASVATLAPGDDAEFTATYTVTTKDVDRGEVRNQASAGYTPPTPRGGPAPAPKVTAPSNVVITPAIVKVQPTVTTKSTVSTVKLAVRANGTTVSKPVADVVTIAGIAAGGAPIQGTATLYGPSTKRSASMCTPGKVARKLTFTAQNGTTRLPAVQVGLPGHYTWVVKLAGNDLNKPAQHACGIAAESFVVSRAAYAAPVISTGFAQAGSSSARVAGAPTNLQFGGLGITAPVQTVGVKRGTMTVPGNVRRLGWLRSSAAIGEAIGTTVIAGHISDQRDRPGAFWRLSKAKVGQVVKIKDGAGKVHRYKVTGKRTYPRSKKLPASLFSTTGSARMLLVSCTGKVTRPGGGFHYTKNLVVTAVPIG
ncbi:DUF11 domain-containing protein [Nocardioides marmoriginsengisoli]|uniref:DUF11 domain-containing protein n=1 Tax=Nocardioides marmoriginsengisoli TaxID=661483 RepID=A0A3N0CB13_9ACTN|nr:sortase [Nocardioides marmoriginsengisoli]RNL60655.1 DUF11 domain-containing protein [Nocardioides marmoriginsengisoli]